MKVVTVYRLDDGRYSVVEQGPLAYFDSIEEAGPLIAFLKKVGVQVN